ncbi:agmatine hydroxycinnamoyltransferase 1-like [Oryza glaberrima]|uniref:agmatine hydroxycinnamoyltransferase 1-like n=1 Tax=Oryza glaberrima TaxID=4538 RepID=UPI00224C5B23|nr:agmatine hydroxycinnamoyltransferase 1-like [Oryza glaberrima]
MAATTPAAAAAAAHVVHIEAVQTAVPTRVVEPGRTRLVAVAAPPLPAPALQRRVRAVLYYRGAGGAAPGAWEDGVWVKESLSEALADHPEMAGRLRRRADGSWEVKLNDTGVRLLQATVDATLDEFLAGKGALARREAALAPWTDVNADDPDMCPPFFMQLTRFQGDGGYAVGVSCVLVLADPLTLARFLLSWARTHARIRAQGKATPLPMAQYLAYFQRPETTRKRIRSVPIDSFAGDGDGDAETVLFRASTAAAAAADGGHGDHRALAAACVDKASEALGKKDKVSRLSVVVVDAAAGDDSLAGKTTIETCTASPGGGAAAGGASLEAVQWSELGLEELVLSDSKPVHVSCSIVTGGGGDEGLVVVMPDDGAGSLLVMATLPK